jgi:parallel beta-helix repeat protein
MDRAPLWIFALSSLLACNPIGRSDGGTVLCLGSSARTIGAPTLFVGPDGHGDNSGTSEVEAFGALSDALCNARPGQTVRILPGTYAESVVLSAFGTDNLSVIVRGVPDDDGNPPVLEGGGTLQVGLGLEDCKNFIIEGLELRGFTDAGMWVRGGSSIVLEDNVFRDNGRRSVDPDLGGEGYGLSAVSAEGLTVTGNLFAANGPGPERRDEAILGAGFHAQALSNSALRDNQAHDNLGAGIRVENATNLRLQANDLSGNLLDAAGQGWSGALWVDGGGEITIQGNDIRDNHGPGLQISDARASGAAGFLVQDNSVRANRWGVYLWNFGACPYPDQERLSFVENDIAASTEADHWCEEWRCGEEQPCP